MSTEALAKGRRPLPPVTQLAVASLALIVVGGIYLAAQIPGPVALAPAVALLLLGAAVLAAAGALLSRVPGFAWARFRQVGMWSLLAYGVSAGMLELVFALDRVPAPELLLLTAMLVVYALDIPLILAFTVARHQAVA